MPGIVSFAMIGLGLVVVFAIYGTVFIAIIIRHYRDEARWWSQQLQERQEVIADESREG